MFRIARADDSGFRSERDDRLMVGSVELGHAQPSVGISRPEDRMRVEAMLQSAYDTGSPIHTRLGDIAETARFSERVGFDGCTTVEVHRPLRHQRCADSAATNARSPPGVDTLLEARSAQEPVSIAFLRRRATPAREPGIKQGWPPLVAPLYRFLNVCRAFPEDFRLTQ